MKDNVDYDKYYHSAFAIDVEGSVGLVSRIDATILRGDLENTLTTKIDNG